MSAEAFWALASLAQIPIWLGIHLWLYRYNEREWGKLHERLAKRVTGRAHQES